MIEPTIRWELRFRAANEWDLPNTIRRVDEQFSVYVEAKNAPTAIQEALKYGAGNILKVDDLYSVVKLTV